MSKGENKRTTTTTKITVKSTKGRPSKGAVKVKQAPKTRVIVAYDELNPDKLKASRKGFDKRTKELQDAYNKTVFGTSDSVPKSVKPLAKAKAAKALPPKRPLGAPRKPLVDVHQLEKSLKEAIAGLSERDKRIVQLENQLAEERADKRTLQRTVSHLQEVIGELKAEKPKRSLFDKLTGRNR